MGLYINFILSKLKFDVLNRHLDVGKDIKSIYYIELLLLSHLNMYCLLNIHPWGKKQ